MTIVRSKTFRSGNSQAVRLPRDVAFASDNLELVIVRSGDVLTIYPARSSLQEMAAKLRALPAPGEIEVRDTEELPEPPGL
jgi:antitoxin VapB